MQVRGVLCVLGPEPGGDHPLVRGALHEEAKRRRNLRERVRRGVARSDRRQVPENVAPQHRRRG